MCPISTAVKRTACTQVASNNINSQIITLGKLTHTAKKVFKEKQNRHAYITSQCPILGRLEQLRPLHPFALNLVKGIIIEWRNLETSRDRRKTPTSTHRCSPKASRLLDTTNTIVAFAISPDAMASMIAPRLDPKPEMRMTSLDVMVDEYKSTMHWHSHFLCTNSQKPMTR